MDKQKGFGSGQSPKTLYDTQKMPRLDKFIYTPQEREHPDLREQGTSVIKHSARDIITLVCAALAEKGYNPVSQLAGYILSGDPTYITGYKDARKLITRLDRDELLEEFVNYYLRGIGRL